MRARHQDDDGHRWRIAKSLLAVCLTTVFVVPAAHAEDNEKPTTVDVHLATDIMVTITAMAVGSVPHLLREELVQDRCAPNCDRSRVNDFDALAIGFRNQEAAQASDGLLAITFAMPVVLGIIDVLVSDGGEGWTGFGKDMLLVAESVAVASMFHGLTKFAVRRPRPYVFDDRASMEERTGADSMLSFFSGHASTGFAAATSYSYLFTLRHPNSRMVPAVWAGMLGLATAETALRPFTGEHYWTDVIVGAAVGTAVGLLIPYLHTSKAAIHIGTHETTMAITPMMLDGGAGLGVSMLNW